MSTIKILDNSMFNGLKKSLLKGDIAYCKEVSESEIKNNNQVYVFFYGKNAVSVRCIDSIDKNILTLRALSKGEIKYPKYTINLQDCSKILKVKKVLTSFL